jgi:hypothetical protein
MSERKGERKGEAKLTRSQALALVGIKRALTPEDKKINLTEDAALLTHLWSYAPPELQANIIACGLKRGGRCADLLDAVTDAREKARANFSSYSPKKSTLKAKERKLELFGTPPREKYQDEKSCLNSSNTWSPKRGYCLASPRSRGGGRSEVARRYRNKKGPCEENGGIYLENGSCRSPTGKGNFAVARDRVMAARAAAAGSPRRAASPYDDANPWA